MKRSPLSRSKPLQTRKGVKPVSAKRRAHRASQEGQDGLAYLRAVKMLPCAVCGAAPPSDAHHCIHERFGTAKASDFDTISLCKRHHQAGPEAIHNGKRTWREKHGPDYSYIEATREAVKRMR